MQSWAREHAIVETRRAASPASTEINPRNRNSYSRRGKLRLYSGIARALALRAQDLAKFAVNRDRFLRGLVHHFHPAPGFLGELGLRHEISGLQNCFEGIAEIMGKGAQLAGYFLRDFVFRSHGFICNEQLLIARRTADSALQFFVLQQLRRFDSLRAPSRY